MDNPTIQIGSVKNGIATADGRGFINPFTALKAFAGWFDPASHRMCAAEPARSSAHIRWERPQLTAC
jgi:hypothetical protein